MKRLLKVTLILGLLGAGLGALAVAGAWWYLAPRLPTIDILRDVRLQVPLRVYSADGRILAEYGEKRRMPVRYAEVPERMIQAVLAAEDDRFFEHPGVDWQGLTRAAWNLLKTGEKGQGGSTITMQVARNFFLSFEKTYLRKVNEIILAFKIEQELSKEEILNLYLNKIFLGQRAYGVGSAAQVYYGKPLDQLGLAQIAMIAGLPKAPSSSNPIANPGRATMRRNYVLRRMLELGFITPTEYAEASAAPITARVHGLNIELDAPYVGEMVRAEMLDRFGEEAYTAGFSVHTTIDSRLQMAAHAAIHDNLLDYTERHGFFGPIAHIDLAAQPDTAAWDQRLADIPHFAGLRPAIVTAVDAQDATAYLGGSDIAIGWDGLSWARRYVDENHREKAPESAADILAAGDVIYVRLGEEGDWRLTQTPRVEGALVSIRPENGAIVALAGGFDFQRSKFNRAVQAHRQPGSNFKPFIYSAALEAGYTAASLINDAPVVFDDPGLEAAWRPENYSGKFFGPTRLRQALVNSRNLVSIRLLREIGINYALQFIKRFGFDTTDFPHDLSLALGSVSVSPLEVVRGYATFANGGFRIEPYLIDRIQGYNGETLFQAAPAAACVPCEDRRAARLAQAAAVEAGTAPLAPDDGFVEPQVLAPRVLPREVVWLMTSMMRDVIRHGTGRGALKLGRSDLAGKTGTTNEQKDAWFSGFNHHLATTVWVGFDEIKPLGGRETGGHAALPMWINFMRIALEGVPERTNPVPEGMVTVRIDPETGKRVAADFPGAVFETFRERYAPSDPLSETAASSGAPAGGAGSVTEQLF